MTASAAAVWRPNAYVVLRERLRCLDLTLLLLAFLPGSYVGQAYVDGLVRPELAHDRCVSRSGPR
jgi:hypothetical protein